MANYPQELAQDAVCQSHTGHMTGLWFLLARPLRMNTNEWMSGRWGRSAATAAPFVEEEPNFPTTSRKLSSSAFVTLAVYYYTYSVVDIATHWNQGFSTVFSKMNIQLNRTNKRVFGKKMENCSRIWRLMNITYLLTYLLTPWCRVLLEKLTGLQLVKNFPLFYGTRRFITAFTSARHLSLSLACSIQSIPPHPISWRLP